MWPATEHDVCRSELQAEEDLCPEALGNLKPVVAEAQGRSHGELGSLRARGALFSRDTSNYAAYKSEQQHSPK